MAKNDSDVGGTLVTVAVVLVGGYVGLSLFANLTKANAASNAQNQNFLQKLLSSLGSGGKGGGGASGFNPGNFGLPNLSSALQAIKDGNGILAQFSGFTDDTGLAGIPLGTTQSAWSVLGNDFGLDPSLFSGLSPNDDTSGAGLIPTGTQSAWSVLGNDFGIDPTQELETNNDTSGAGLIDLGGGDGGGVGFGPDDE